MTTNRIAAIAFAVFALACAADAATATQFDAGRQGVRDWCDQTGGLLTEHDTSTTCLTPRNGATMTCHSDGVCIRIGPRVAGLGSEPSRSVPSIGLSTGGPPNNGGGVGVGGIDGPIYQQN